MVRTTKRTYAKARKHILGVLPPVEIGVERAWLWKMIITYCNRTKASWEDDALDMQAYLLEDQLLRNIENPKHLSSQEERSIMRTSEELRRHHARFRACLKWLCTPKGPRPTIPPSTVRQLIESGRLEFGRHPFIGKRDEMHVRYLEEHGLRHMRFRAHLDELGRLAVRPVCLHTIDLLLAFVISECAGKEEAQLPVKVCRRAACGQFFLPRRSTKEFCSDQCRVRAYWTPEKWRLYMKERRLKKLPPGVRRRKLSQMASQDRRKRR